MAHDNENWGKCPKCGAPVLIDPDTSQPEACSNCNSKASPIGLYVGIFGIVLGLVAVGLLAFFGIRLLVG